MNNEVKCTEKPQRCNKVEKAKIFGNKREMKDTVNKTKIYETRVENSIDKKQCCFSILFEWTPATKLSINIFLSALYRVYVWFKLLFFVVIINI